jgi:hypothetical protein
VAELTDVRQLVEQLGLGAEAGPLECAPEWKANFIALLAGAGSATTPKEAVRGWSEVTNRPQT